MRTAIASLILIGLLMTVTAQAATLDAENNVLLGMRGDGEYVMSTSQSDGEGGCWGSGVGGLSGPYTGEGREWAFRNVAKFSSPLELDPAGEIEVYFIGGAGTGEGGQADYFWELTAGGAVVASGSGGTLQYADCSATWSDTASPEITTLAAGTELQWRVYTENHFATGGRMNLLSDGDASSRIVLPILAGSGGNGPDVPEPETFFANITDASIDLAFDEATSDTYHYNWTTNATDVTIGYDVGVQNGSVRLQVLDDAGTAVLDSTVTADFNDTQDYADFVAGNWTIRVGFDAFVGNVSLDVTPAGQEPPPSDDDTAADPGGEGSPSPTGTPDGSDGDGQEADGEDESSGIPGPGLSVLLVLFGAVVLARRRR